MYRKLSPGAAVDVDMSVGEMTGKTNRICDALLVELEKHADIRLQNIITANVCKLPPDLDAGLTVVGKLQTSNSDQAEKAAEHICFLADVNQLFDNALGLYNLDLALLIAQQSQKDPREYLPYLQSLQELPKLRRLYKIDDKLGRRQKALQHLYDLDVFEEFKTYTQKHVLYDQALELLKYNQNRLNDIMRLYAEFLHSSHRYREASIGTY
jgi:elongator complex protein 1